MLQNLLRVVVSFAVVFSAYAVYSVTVVRLIEPEVTFVDRPHEREPGAQRKVHHNDLTHLFAPGSWELASPKVLDTSQGKLLFEDYTPLEGGQLKVKPFTLVFYSGGDDIERKADRRPFVMQAPEGAILNFDKEIDLARADIGRIIGGRLLGDIKIFSPESKPGAADALELLTRNVQINEERIWTVHYVEFTYGKNHGRGRDLSLILLPDDKNNADPRAPSFRGIKSLELVNVDRFYLYAKQKGLMPGGKQETVTAQGETAPNDNEGPIEITCRGPFLFDFEKKAASFERDVDVLHHYKDGPSDSLNCQLLELFFYSEDSTNAEEVAVDDGKPEKQDLSDLALSRLVAVGHPAKLEAPSKNARAQAQRMEYDFLAQRITLDDDHRVTLHHNDSYVEAIHVEYDVPEGRRVGKIRAHGPGRMTGSIEVTENTPQGEVKRKKPVEAKWVKSLQLRPHEGRHLLSLDTGAEVRFDTATFRSHQLYVWLEEIQPNPDLARFPTATPEKKSDKGELPSFDVRPDRLVAIGQVTIDSPQLTGVTNRLEAWFRYETAAIAATGNPSTSAPGGGQGATGTAGGNTTGSGHPASSGSNRGGGLSSFVGAPGQDPLKPAQKFSLEGDLIRLQLLRRGDETLVEKVTIDRNVKFVETQTTQVGESPMVITGDTLLVEGGNSPSSFIKIVGEPASVAGRGLSINASNVQLHRGQNRMWIEGPGSMRLPGPKKNPLGESSGTLIAGNAPPFIDVTWKERMDFDGRTAIFLRGVRAQGGTQLAMTEELQVTLSSQIDFSNPDNKQKAEPSETRFRNGVFIENRSFENRKLTAIDQMQFNDLTINHQSGYIHASGPGWIDSVRLGQGNPLAPTSPAAAAPAPRPKKDGLSHMNIEFQREIVGNYLRRELEFIEQVKTIYGPVKNWKEKLTGDRQGGLGADGVLVTSDRLNLAEIGPKITESRRAIEIQATGNTSVEGNLFTARAARLSYVEAKQLIVLEGDGRSDAQIVHQERIGGDRSRAAARKIYIWQADNRVEVDDGSVLDITNFGRLRSMAPQR